MIGKMMCIAAVAALLGACGGGGEQRNDAAAEPVPASLLAGEYELTAKVDQLRSTDQTTPATSLQQDASATSRTCVAADGTIEPAAFGEQGDTCTATESYVRNGRMSIQLRCTRPGKAGNVMQLVDGDYTADGFEAKVLGSTALSGTGDYEMTRTITAKRVGECAAESAQG